MTITDCSTLEVPVDYSDPHSSRFNLSLIRLKAAHSLPMAHCLSIPGGPGGSGVDLVRSAGDVISKSVGGHYDIIGFDPRGMGRSNTIRCFKDGTESKFFLAKKKSFLNPGDNLARFRHRFRSSFKSIHYKKFRLLTVRLDRSSG